MNTQLRNNNGVFGFSLIELLVVIAIVSIIAAIAAPSYLNYLDRQKLTAATEHMVSDLRWAKGEAIKRNADIEFSITSGANGSWSYVVGGAGLDGSIYPDISVDSDFSTFTFDHVRGLTTPASLKTVTLTSPQANESRVTVSVMGTIGVCGIVGVAAC
ncbi:MULTISPECIES: GspH/FimT family pseudopilin [unclassified Marinobacterium]|uniref:GspH/FimT family pseudopilin n=1 Tax=unclassified Marinobacterium TaxID=2644139 RepID=UPI00156A0E22|nr:MULTISPECIES: GspH/FimT family pseudopilin [unclassified Marinobacterium]NRP46104.1 Fimbrial protein precursor [Marinobacterium sp. xm-d-543]NRQ22441.1 Fimbrial protein precursor [Marinobacterium sp. xm-m-312]